LRTGHRLFPAKLALTVVDVSCARSFFTEEGGKPITLSCSNWDQTSGPVLRTQDQSNFFTTEFSVYLLNKKFTQNTQKRTSPLTPKGSMARKTGKKGEKNKYNINRKIIRRP